MTKKARTSKDAGEKVVKYIRRMTRQTYSAEEKIRFILAKLRGDHAWLARQQAFQPAIFRCVKPLNSLNNSHGARD